MYAVPLEDELKGAPISRSLLPSPFKSPSEDTL
jgi:hypothetical protein